LKTVPGEHVICSVWVMQEFVTAFQAWLTGQIWHKPVFWFQYGIFDEHCEHDFESEFQIGRFGGHKEFCDSGCWTEVIL
jgi:hypothetical protein